MADLIEQNIWEPTVYQIAITDDVVGGTDGISNIQAKQLANRTKYLKTRTDAADASLLLKADKNSPVLTGTPSAPTAAAGTNTTQLASTAFVEAVRVILAAADTQKAPLASPALTGIPTAPTAAVGTNTTQIATMAAVNAAIAALVASSPAALDTLNELAAAMGDDANFSVTMTNALALKAALASPTFTGTPSAPTAAAGTNTTQLASTAFVEAARLILANADALKAPLASPALTGTPTAPTPAASDNSTKLATTAYVQAELTADLATAAPSALGTAAVGNSLKRARENHVHGMPTLDALANTTITANSAGEILEWNGTAWINQTLAEAGIAPLNNAALTGAPTAPTQATSDKSTKLATTEWFYNAIAAVAIAAGFLVSLTANGYIKFPSWLGGLIIQWGIGAVAQGSSQVIALPIAFPNSIYMASNCPQNAVGNWGLCEMTNLSTITLRVGGGAGGTLGTTWLTIGR